MHSINLKAALQTVNDYWSPKIVGQVNDQYVKVAKLKGELTWHSHDNEDEMFQVLRGHLRIELEQEQAVELDEGDVYIVRKGVRHNPVAKEECWIMLIETVTTKHTGDVVTPFTRTIEQQKS